MSAINSESAEKDKGSIYLAGKAADQSEPRLWLLQTLSFKILHLCERNYHSHKVSDSSPWRRRWLNVWRSMKATFEAFWLENDEELEELGGKASEVLRRLNGSQNVESEGQCWPTPMSLEPIGLLGEHYLGDVPSLIELGREGARQMLINSLKYKMLKHDPETGRIVQPYEWEPTSTAAGVATMVPAYASMLHEVYVAKPTSPSKPLVPDDRARFFPRELDREIEARLTVEYIDWRERHCAEGKWRQERFANVTDDDFAELARAFLRALGAQRTHVNNAMRESDKLEKTQADSPKLLKQAPEG